MKSLFFQISIYLANNFYIQGITCTMNLKREKLQYYYQEKENNNNKETNSGIGGKIIAWLCNHTMMTIIHLKNVDIITLSGAYVDLYLDRNALNVIMPEKLSYCFQDCFMNQFIYLPGWGHWQEADGHETTRFHHKASKENWNNTEVLERYNSFLSIVCLGLPSPRPLPDIHFFIFLSLSASEMRNWLLFYGLPCLDGILPEKYFINFSYLVNGVYLLLKDEITHQDIVIADYSLRNFYLHAEIYYGEFFTLSSYLTCSMWGYFHTDSHLIICNFNLVQ